MRKLNGIQTDVLLESGNFLKNWKCPLSLLAKHEHMLKVYFVKNFFFHMAQEKSLQIYEWERYGHSHLFSAKWEKNLNFYHKSTAWE